MKKRVCALLLCLCMVITLLPTVVSAGTVYDNWQQAGAAAASPTDYEWNADKTALTVKTALGLAKLANIANGEGGETINDFAGKTVLLANDINLNSCTFATEGTDANSWVPIGTGAQQFNGTFDGQGHIISGMRIYQPMGSNYGLFGTTGEMSVVRNLIVNDSQVLAYAYAAGIVGNCLGLIRNCAFVGSIMGVNPGGVVGYLHPKGSMKLCYAAGSVQTNNAAAIEPAGGVVGGLAGEAIDCYYLTTSADQGYSYADNADASFIHAKSETDMKSAEFINVLNAALKALNDKTLKLWGTDDAANGGYPVMTLPSTWEQAGTLATAPADYEWNADKTALTVKTPLGLAKFANMVSGKGGETENDFSGKTVRLANDINLNDGTVKGYDGDFDTEINATNSWYPIGSLWSPFSGTFDGQAYAIDGVRMNHELENDCALFGCTNEGATVRNLGVRNAEIRGDYAAGIVSYCDGNIFNCYVTGSITDIGWHPGGLACHLGRSGKLKLCYVAATVNKEFENPDTLHTGGALADDVYGWIEDCYYASFATYYPYADDHYYQIDLGRIHKVNGEDMKTASFVEDLNLLVRNSDDGSLKLWQADAASVNDGYPVQTYPTTWEEVGTQAGAPTDYEWNEANTVLTIKTAPGLAKFANMVNGKGGETASDFSGKTVRLANNLDLNGGYVKNYDGDFNKAVNATNSWVSIGAIREQPFNGTFDGQGHTINGVRININWEDFLSLFGYTGENVVVRNLGVTDSHVNGNSFSGGIVGHCQGIIRNCYFSGSVKSSNAGGITGYLEASASIKLCYSVGSVSKASAYSAYPAGGIAGAVCAEAKECYYLDTGAQAGCSYVGNPSISVEGIHSKSEAYMKSADFVAELNGILKNYDSADFYTWQTSTNGYPVFGERYKHQLTAVTVSGTLGIGETLTAQARYKTTDATADYRWQASVNGTDNWTDIAGATAQTYIIDGAYVAQYLRVVANGNDAFAGSATSDKTAQVPYTVRVAMQNNVGSDHVYIGTADTTQVYTLSGGLFIGANIELAGTLYNKVSFDKTVENSVYTVNPADAINGVITITATFTHTDKYILEATDFLFAVQTDMVYDGTEQAAIVTANDNANGKIGKITVKYYDSTGTTEVAPKDVGTYTVKIDVAEGAEYAAATDLTDASWTFEIGQRELTVTPDANQYKYYGQSDPTITYSYSGNVAGEVPALSGYFGRYNGESIGQYLLVYPNISMRDNGSFKAANYTLSCDTTVNFTIKSYEPTETATLAPDGDNGWFKTGDVVLHAPTGFQIGESDDVYTTLDWADTLTLDGADGAEKTATYYLIETATGAISVQKTVTYRVDTTAPTAVRVRYNQGEWTQLPDTAAFTKLFAAPLAVSAQATDGLSGMAGCRYYVADAEVTDFSAVTWQDSLTITQSGRKMIYVKATDKAGNAVISHEGILVYTDSTLNPASAEFDRNLDGMQDIAITLELNGNTLKEIKNGTAVLVDGTDYTLSGNVVTLSKAYLAVLAQEDAFTLTFVFSPMGVAGDVVVTADLAVTVIDSSVCDGGDTCICKHFTDMPSAENWAHAGIDFCVKKGLLVGTSETTFSPNDNMTRAALVVTLWRLDKKPVPTADNPFEDVPDGKWYSDAIVWAAENEIVNGIGDGKFDPNGNVTREQIAAILFRYAAYKGCDTTRTADLSAFPDASEISDYAKVALSWANAEALINGASGKLLPKGNATRAQVAAILMRFAYRYIL